MRKKIKIFCQYLFSGVTNVIQEQSSEARKKRQEQIKREKDEQRKAMGAAQKLKFKAFTKKQAPEEVDTAFLSSKLMAMKGRMIGKAWTNRAAERKEIEKMQAEKPKELISETLRKARGPYKTTDPLHMCHLNSNCHRRKENSKRCGSHEMDKAEAEKKQRVHFSLVILKDSTSINNSLYFLLFLIYMNLSMIIEST